MQPRASGAEKTSAFAGETACATPVTPVFGLVGQAVPPAGLSCQQFFSDPSARGSLMITATRLHGSVKKCKALGEPGNSALQQWWVPGMEQHGKSILLVEDDTNLCSLMRAFFAPYGYQIEAVHDGRRGLARALEGEFDLVILDVMLPVIDGFEVLRQLRKRSSVPVIMLTARTEQEDRIAGLNAGADDYLPKPFGPEELLARMRAVWRRAQKSAPAERDPLVAGSLRVELDSRTTWGNDQPLPLTSVEFDMLELLIRSAGRVVSRDELAASVLQREFTPYDRSVDVHISHLRKKLEGMATIQTVRGAGYLFVPAAAAVDTQK